MSDAFAVLQRIRELQPRDLVPAIERCELCGEPISAEHGHLVDLGARNLLCACRGCYLLFVSEGAGGARYRAVPDRYVSFPDFQLGPGQWESLQIPVGLAFFFFNSSLGRMAAFYPGPAGATESELALDTWEEILAENPELGTLQPDVEAFLVRAERNRGGAECFIVPIDACYELVGKMRRMWRGFDGGQEVRDELDRFFARVEDRAVKDRAR